MAYFGTNLPEEEIMEICKSLQQGGCSANKIILALSRVLHYYAEYEVEENLDDGTA